MENETLANETVRDVRVMRDIEEMDVKFPDLVEVDKTAVEMVEVAPSPEKTDTLLIVARDSAPVTLLSPMSVEKTDVFPSPDLVRSVAF